MAVKTARTTRPRMESGRWRKKKRRSRPHLRRAGRGGGPGSRRSALGRSRSLIGSPSFSALGGGYKGGVEDFDVALLAQIGEPVVEEGVHLLLQQNLFNARRHLIERRDRLAGVILRNQGVFVVGGDLFLRDADALAEALLDEVQNLQPVAEIGLDARGGEMVRGEKVFPARVGRAALADAGGELVAELAKA